MSTVTLETADWQRLLYAATVGPPLASANTQDSRILDALHAVQPLPPPPTGPAAGLVLNSDTESALTAAAIAAVQPRVLRAEFGIGSSPEAVAKLQAKFGIPVQALLGFSGRLPTAAEAQGVARFVGAGTRLKEFGNETPYQIPPTYTNGLVYGERAAEAIRALAPYGEGLLVQAQGPRGTPAWTEGVLAGMHGTAPAGWTIHPYPNNTTIAGTDTWGLTMMTELAAALEKHGDRTTPIYATEWGVPSINGGTLSDNKHFTYTEAAQMCTTHVGRLREAAKGRLAQLLVYCAHDLATVGSTTNREEFFGAVLVNGAVKGAFTPAVKSLLNS